MALAESHSPAIISLSIATFRGIIDYARAVTGWVGRIHVDGNKFIAPASLGLISSTREGACIIRGWHATNRITAVAFTIVLNSSVAEVVAYELSAGSIMMRCRGITFAYGGTSLDSHLLFIQANRGEYKGPRSAGIRIASSVKIRSEWDTTGWRGRSIVASNKRCE